MDFKEQLAITLVDKAAIGALLFLAGVLASRALERFKSQQARDRPVATPQSTAVRVLLATLSTISEGQCCLGTNPG